ncbi:hypothetical protein NDU88_005670 [Pleurodeles waltl]|uniref:Uncharacterized protein n=1 Tax=Pleurodeles waltl TaxID=8319 RepID=A0AAV7WXQ5_PLEWA|nr:hypothetical protein NDU88_005670 [Pleurodeles waltl]
MRRAPKGAELTATDSSGVADQLRTGVQLLLPIRVLPRALHGSGSGGKWPGNRAAAERRTTASWSREQWCQGCGELRWRSRTKWWVSAISEELEVCTGCSWWTERARTSGAGEGRGGWGPGPLGDRGWVWQLQKMTGGA